MSNLHFVNCIRFNLHL